MSEKVSIEIPGTIIITLYKLEGGKTKGDEELGIPVEKVREMLEDELNETGELGELFKSGSKTITAEKEEGGWWYYAEADVYGVKIVKEKKKPKHYIPPGTGNAYKAGREKQIDEMYEIDKRRGVTK